MPAVVSLDAKRVDKLSAKAAAHDREAFGALCDRYHAELLSYARRRVPTREDAEDLVEHAFYKALRSIPSKDRRNPFNVWLFHIAKNLITDFYRTQKRHEPIEDEVSMVVSAEGEPALWTVERGRLRPDTSPARSDSGAVSGRAGVPRDRAAARAAAPGGGAEQLAGRVPRLERAGEGNLVAVWIA